MRKFEALSFSSDISRRISTVVVTTCNRPPVTGAVTSSDVMPIFSVCKVMSAPGSIAHVPVGLAIALACQMVATAQRTRARSGS